MHNKAQNVRNHAFDCRQGLTTFKSSSKTNKPKALQLILE